MLGWVWFALTAWAVTACALAMIWRGDLAGADGAIGTVSEVDAAEVHG